MTRAIPGMQVELTEDGGYEKILLFECTCSWRKGSDLPVVFVSGIAMSAKDSQNRSFHFSYG